MTFFGKANYEAYREFSRGASLVTGEPIPAWDDLPVHVQSGWDAGADAALALAAQAQVHLATRPVVIVFDPRECGLPWLDELATAVREQSGGRVIITEVDAGMSDVMIAVAGREVPLAEALSIWRGDDE